jgi:hypothetical protein
MREMQKVPERFTANEDRRRNQEDLRLRQVWTKNAASLLVVFKPDSGVTRNWKRWPFPPSNHKAVKIFFTEKALAAFYFYINIFTLTKRNSFPHCVIGSFILE